MSTSAFGYVEATAFLDLCSPPSLHEHLVSSKGQSVTAQRHDAQSHLSPNHASSVSVFFPSRGSPNGYIVARLLEKNRCLELRWLSLVQRAVGDVGETRGGVYDHLDAQAAVPPVRFQFADPLVPDVQLAEGDGTLIVHALSTAGILYRLKFTGPHFFATDELEEGYSSEYTVGGLSGRTPTLLHGVDTDAVIATCADGTAFLLQREDKHRSGDAWRETELKASNGYLAMISSRFSTRNIAALANDTSSPQQTIALTSLVGGSQGPYNHSYTFSRDGKLRIWEHVNGTCLREINLASSTTLLNSPPRKLLRVVHVENDRDFGAYLMALVSEEFRLYGIPRGARKGHDLREIGKQRCPSAYRGEDLRDFSLALLDPAIRAGEADQRWTLWTWWERSDGEPAFAFVRLAGAGAAEEEWTYVELAEQTAWNADYFDDLLSIETTKSVNDVFMQHIFAPGRYAEDTLRDALADYTEAVVNVEGSHPPALMRGDDYDSLPEQVAEVVGCTLSLEVSSETGQFMHAVFDSKLRTEWLRFVSLCNEGRAASRFPLALAVDERRKLVVGFGRDACSTPVAQDLHQLLAGDEEALDRFETLPQLAFTSLPALASLSARHIIAVLVRCARMLSAAVPSDAMRDFEAGVKAVFRTMRKQSYEELAITLFQDVIEDTVDEEVFEALSDTLKEVLPHLAQAWPVLFPVEANHSDEGGRVATDFALALTTSAAALSIEARYTLSLQLLLLLTYLVSDEEVLTPAASPLLPLTFTTFHGLSVLRYMARASAPSYIPLPLGPADDESGSLASRFGHMQVNPDEAVPQAQTTSLLGAAARGLRRQPPVPLPSDSLASPSAFSGAVDGLLRGLGLLNPALANGNASLFDDFIYLDTTHALELIQCYPPDDHGMQFVKACAFLALGRYADAQHAFVRAAAGLVTPTGQSSSSSLISILHDPSLPESPERLFLYYHSIAGFFYDSSAAAQVAFFSRLALEARTDTPLNEIPEIDVDDLTRDLWQKLFDAEVAQNGFEAAYATLAAIPYSDVQETCLRSLVANMCEAGEIDKLLRFPFVKLQTQLAAHLEYRARHARFGSVPDYHQVAYAYFMSRNDHRNAASVMLQRIRQLDSRASQERITFHDAGRERCRSYLAAINALYLVDKDDAWLAAPSVDESLPVKKRGADDDPSLPPGPKRRRLAASGKHSVVDHIPIEAHGQEFKGRIDIVTLDMLREEYTLALAKLSLASSFPELARADIDMDPEGVVALYAQTGALSSAFAVAQTLDADMTPLFQQLAAKCVQLSRGDPYSSGNDADWLNAMDEAAGLESAPALRGWQVLRIHLERYDQPDGRYRAAVLKRTLAEDRQVSLPQWLLGRMVATDADSLLRAYIQHDRFDEAVQVALGLVKQAQSTLDKAATPRASLLRLPYAQFDCLLAVELSSTHEADKRSKSLQTALQQALDTLLPSIARAGESLQSSHRKTQAKARRD